MHNYDDYEPTPLTAGATISLFVFVLAMVLGLLLG